MLYLPPAQCKHGVIPVGSRCKNVRLPGTARSSTTTPTRLTRWRWCFTTEPHPSIIDRSDTIGSEPQPAPRPNNTPVDRQTGNTFCRSRVVAMPTRLARASSFGSASLRRAFRFSSGGGRCEGGGRHLSRPRAPKRHPRASPFMRGRRRSYVTTTHDWLLPLSSPAAAVSHRVVSHRRLAPPSRVAPRLAPRHLVAAPWRRRRRLTAVLPEPDRRRLQPLAARLLGRRRLGLRHDRHAVVDLGPRPRDRRQLVELVARRPGRGLRPGSFSCTRFVRIVVFVARGSILSRAPFRVCTYSVVCIL